MNQQTTAVEPASRQCFGCHYEGPGTTNQCPKCGRKVFLTAKNIRIRGGVVIGVGLFLVAMMSGISIFVWALFAGNPEAAKKAAEEKYLFLAIFGLFGLLIVLGLHFVITGGWMLAFGKRNRYLIWAMFVLIFVVIFTGSFITAFID